MTNYTSELQKIDGIELNKQLSDSGKYEITADNKNNDIHLEPLDGSICWGDKRRFERVKEKSVRVNGLALSSHSVTFYLWSRVDSQEFADELAEVV